MSHRLKSSHAVIGAVSALCLTFATQAATALDPKSENPRAIFRAVADAQTGDRSMSRLKMSIRDKTGTRERILSLRGKRFDNARKTLVMIEQPADVRDTGFLSIDHRDRSDEQWLYLPKLHRVSRVPSSGKADAFVGSDFSISDLSPQDPDSYEVKLVQASVKVGDEECWLLETTPINETVREETGYTKTQFWVSKQKLVSLQFKAWLHGGTKTKYFKAADLRNVDGIWMPHRMNMRTLEGNNVSSETTLEVLKADNKSDLPDSDFTQQRLAQGV